MIDTSNWAGQYVQVADNIFFAHAGYQRIDGEFTPGEYNPVLARMNQLMVSSNQQLTGVGTSSAM
ncbi:MAG: hypothetical protein ACO3MB_06930 [Saprospiraceae bacterium]